ncbi:MAG: enoyl-CoA hydratase-related protein [Caulobacteraceae bacterium]
MDIDTGTTDLLAALDEGVLTLTLNRSEARNAMSGAMTAALAAQLAAAELNREVKCVVLTGAGKGFCAGGDVKGMAASGDGTVGDNTIDGAIHRQRVNQRATAGKLFSMPKPTIAALPGAAAAPGFRWRWPATCGSWPATPS